MIMIIAAKGLMKVSDCQVYAFAYLLVCPSFFEVYWMHLASLA